MKDVTKNTLDILSKKEWFYALGVQDSATAIVLDSWDKAIESCSSDDWQNLLIEAANSLRSRIIKASLSRFKEWNVVVQGLKPYVVPLVNEKIAKVVEANNLPKKFEDVVQWDILHLAIEAEYSDLVAPSFYSSQSYWYVNGHFPCGWKGKFPKGQLIIY